MTDDTYEEFVWALNEPVQIAITGEPGVVKAMRRDVLETEAMYRIEYIDSNRCFRNEWLPGSALSTFEARPQ